MTNCCDDDGTLHLSKAAQEFHPGQGVYRSSYKNAMRLARTETNMAYRKADHERQQDLFFVVGKRVVLSNNHTCLNSKGEPEPFTDICDELQGDYPKDFDFPGWHPQCRCHVESILMTEEEMKANMERILNGEEPLTGSVNEVTDVPDNFKQWVEDNAERIENAKNMPYFLENNAQYMGNEAQNKDGQPNVEHATSVAMPGVHNNRTKTEAEIFNEYVERYSQSSERVGELAQRLNDGGLTYAEKCRITKELKLECAELTKQELIENGLVGKDWKYVDTEINHLLQGKFSYVTPNGSGYINEARIDLVVFRDDRGVEFAYRIGADASFFKATIASDVIKSFPPYLNKGVERVTFLDIPNPTDPFFSAKHNIPNFRAAATDGGQTTFFMTPRDAEEFKQYMSHEAGHIIDTDNVLSSSKLWKDAVAADESYMRSGIRVSDYAKTCDSEDFAECMRMYINNHDWFKLLFPNRAQAIRAFAKGLSMN